MLAEVKFEEFSRFVEGLGPKLARSFSKHLADSVLQRVKQNDDRAEKMDRHRLKNIGTRRRFAFSAPCQVAVVIGVVALVGIQLSPCQSQTKLRISDDMHGFVVKVVEDDLAAALERVESGTIGVILASLISNFAVSFLVLKKVLLIPGRTTSSSQEPREDRLSHSIAKLANQVPRAIEQRDRWVRSCTDCVMVPDAPES